MRSPSSFRTSGCPGKWYRASVCPEPILIVSRIAQDTEHILIGLVVSNCKDEIVFWSSIMFFSHRSLVNIARPDLDHFISVNDMKLRSRLDTTIKRLDILLLLMSMWFIKNKNP